MKSRSLSSRACGWRLILVAALALVLCSSAVVLQNSTALAQSANPTRDLPNAPVERGETFDVMVTFTAPEDNFNSIGLVDNVPSGWAIQVDKTWCTPNADQHNIVGDQAQYVWYGPYDAGQAFTALYRVTVPGDAALASYTFDGELGYKIGGGDRIFEAIGGDFQVTVDAPHLCTTPDPPSHDFGTIVSGDIVNWSFDITNCGIGQLEWTVTPSEGWIHVAPASGTTTTETDSVGVTIDTSELMACPQNPHNGTITINSNGGAGGDESKMGNISIVVTMLAIRDLPSSAIVNGPAFEVHVEFTAPNNEFNSIGLVDNVPSGWAIQVDKTWCTPNADEHNIVGDQVQYTWNGSYVAGTSFTAIYKVSVPSGVTPGPYAFPGGLINYCIGGQCGCSVNVSGDSDIEVIEGTPVVGVTREVNCDLLPGVNIMLDGIGPEVSDGDALYEIIATATGDYDVVASKVGFRDRTQTINVEGLGPEYTVTCNFQAQYGLIPNAPDIWYALDCVNLWLYPPNAECGLDIWTALDVINAWLYPIVE